LDGARQVSKGLELISFQQLLTLDHHTNGTTNIAIAVHSAYWFIAPDEYYESQARKMKTG
jgi:hypothetical protein